MIYSLFPCLVRYLTMLMTIICAWSIALYYNWKKILEYDIGLSINWFHDNDMDANPEKFQCAVLGKYNSESFNINVQNNIIVPQKSIKVLGVSLDDHLNFNTHVSNICRRASRQIMAFKRIAKYLNLSNRELTYKSFISSNFSYSPTSWIFCGKQNTNKLNKLQERALRIVYQDNASSYESLLAKGNFLSLSICRLK